MARAKGERKRSGRKARLPLALLGLFLAAVAGALGAAALLPGAPDAPEPAASLALAPAEPGHGAPETHAASGSANDRGGGETNAHPDTPADYAAATAPKSADAAPPERASAPPPAETAERPARVPEPPPAQTSVAEPPPRRLAPEPAEGGPAQIASLPDGKKPFDAFRRPFPANDTRPRVAIVLTGLGLSSEATKTAIEGLPGGVTLSFSPYGDSLETWMALARAAGHEILLDLPMEPVNFPNFDPGPQALLTSLSDEANLQRLDWALERGGAYAGVVVHMGSHFTATAQKLRPVLAALAGRGLMFVDSRSARRSAAPALARELGLTYAANLRFIDDHASRAAIDANLKELETAARAGGHALGIAAPYPVTLERLASWTASLGRQGIALAPASAVVEAPDALAKGE